MAPVTFVLTVNGVVNKKYNPLSEKILILLTRGAIYGRIVQAGRYDAMTDSCNLYRFLLSVINSHFLGK